MTGSAFYPLKHLKCLSRIFPVKGAVVVGAGLGEDPWFDVLQKTDAKVLLVEAAADRCKQLKQNYSCQDSWLFQQQVVAGVESECFFYVMAHSAENSLLHPDQLRDLWPHAKLKEESACQTVTLDALCGQTDIVPNWLVLNCLPALDILQGAGRVLSEVDVLIARVIGDNGCQIMQASQKEIDSFMQHQGFIFYGAEVERNPALGHVVYLRDITGQNHQYRVELRNFGEQVEELETAIHRSKEKIARDEKHLKQLKRDVEESKKIILELNYKREQKKDSLKKRDSLEKIIKNEFINNYKQIENILSVHHFLRKGEVFPLFRDWSICSNFALYLIDLLFLKKYDFIIEFGSGASTVIVAKALQKIKFRENIRIKYQVFEHKKKYYDQSLESLRQVGLESFVKIGYAPLKEYKSPGGSHYSYYECQDVLSEIAQDFGSEISKLLLIVDGPPGSTCKHARYPALPIALSQFKGAEIDILLDDYNREEEKEVASMWLKDIEGLGLQARVEKIEMQKGACFLQILPQNVDV